MKKSNFLKTVILAVIFSGTAVSANAQSFKEKMKAAKDKLEQAASGGSNKPVVEEKKAEEVKELNEWHKSKVGQIVFYDKGIRWESSSTGDSQTNVITERVLGENKPFAFRAYLGKPYSYNCEDCKNMDIRYTIEGISVTTQQLKEDLPAFYRKMATALSFYDKNNYTLGVAMTSEPGYYAENYTMQEDAFRILLSKVKDKLKIGSTVNMKVEVFAINSEGMQVGEVLASGEIPLKITAESKNLQNLNCRCAKAGMTDAAVIEDVKKAFAFQLDDVVKVYKVVLNDRDWNMYYDNSYPTKQIIAKGMHANIIFERADGVFMQVKRVVFYDKTPSGFADKIKIGEHVYFAPVSPTCAM